MPAQPHLIDTTQAVIHEADLSREDARGWLQHISSDRVRRHDANTERLLQRTREWLKQHRPRRAERR